MKNYTFWILQLPIKDDASKWVFENNTMDTKIVWRNFDFHSSPPSSPVGCPGFCWLIDSVWPFVLLWKSIQQTFMLRVSSSLFISIYFVFVTFVRKKRRQIKHSRVSEQFEIFLENASLFLLFVWGAEIFFCLASSQCLLPFVRELWSLTTSWYFFVFADKREAI